LEKRGTRAREHTYQCGKNQSRKGEITRKKKGGGVRKRRKKNFFGADQKGVGDAIFTGGKRASNKKSVVTIPSQEPNRNTGQIPRGGCWLREKGARGGERFAKNETEKNRPCVRGRGTAPKEAAWGLGGKRKQKKGLEVTKKNA